jgi:molybdate transport repressor ModE-like protein
MRPKSKVWLEVEGEPIIGSGREALLREIDRLGSINKAAAAVNISYKKALSYIQAMEKRLGKRLVIRKKGGINGGGAALTQEARTLLTKFEQLECDLIDFVDSRFREIFNDNK